VSGTSARPGSRIRVDVSTGPSPAAPAAVPNVVNKAQSTAATAIRDAGFKVVVLIRPTTSPGKDGLVLEQQPVEGTSVPKEMYVALFVGRLS
jgi:beta-lactam-binding protein with PASTA domain